MLRAHIGDCDDDDDDDGAEDDDAQKSTRLHPEEALCSNRVIIVIARCATVLDCCWMRDRDRDLIFATSTKTSRARTQ